MRRRVNFVSDLDHTLIHSGYPQERCVEYLANGKPITYMTPKAYAQLQQLRALPHFTLIPCTMRSFAQLQRIEFFKTPPPWAICLNGAEIYCDGVLQLAWTQHVRANCPRESVQSDYARVQQLARAEDEVRNIDDFFVVIRCRDELSACERLSQLQAVFATTRTLFRTNKKIYLILPWLNKARAVDFLQTHAQLEVSLTAGDSEADHDFTQIGQALLPQHATFRHPAAFVTRQSGIAASEEILTAVRRQCER